MPSNDNSSIRLPETPADLRWLLAKKIGIGAILVGLLGGISAFALISYRTDVATMQQVLAGVRHFTSPAMRIATDITQQDHTEIDRMLDRSGIFGVRVFDRNKNVLMERWAPVQSSLVEAVQAQSHSWPESDASHTTSFSIGDVRINRVVLPLYGNGDLIGYLEGLSQVTADELARQRQQALDVSAISGLAALIAAALLYPLMLAMLNRTNRLSQGLLESNISLMRSLGNAIAKRDSETDAHNYRVTCYAVALAEKLRLPEQLIADLVVGAFLHDVGKIGIPDQILLKPGKLTPEEFTVMQSHALLGVEIIADNPWLGAAASTIRHHHERFDGKGYPDGLAGEAIPLPARIFALVDVFDALTSTRPYKPALSLEETMAIMEEEADSHFDPALYEHFQMLAADLYNRGSTWGHDAWAGELRAILCRYFRMKNTPLPGRCEICH